MTKPLKAVLVGAGGYGQTYARYFLADGEKDLELVAVVDPLFEYAPDRDALKKLCPVYNSLEDFFATGEKVDLTIVSSPLHVHFQQSLEALENGSHVLCEKPLVPTIQQLNQLEIKAAEVGKTLSVGFQLCYLDVVQQLKKRIQSGEFGKILDCKILVSWPREHAYYARSRWAGRITSDDGLVVNDSVITNATSHYIQNLMYLLGKTTEESAPFDNITIETYRANDIESFDTCVCRGESDGIPVLYAGSHAVNYKIGPLMHFSFEKAKVEFNIIEGDAQCAIYYKDGQVETPENILTYGADDKLDFIANSIRTGAPLTCTGKTVRSVTAFFEAMFNEITIHNFPEELITIDNSWGGKDITYVKDLHHDLTECFDKLKLPSELGMPWAKEPVKLSI